MLDPLRILELPYAQTLDPMSLSTTFDTSKLPRMTSEMCFGLRRPSTDLKEFVPDLEHRLVAKGHYVSKTDRSKGHDAEQLFAQKMQALGHSVYKVPHFSHNYLRHIDFEILDNQKQSANFDIKAPKALRKATNRYQDAYTEPQNTYVCMELNASGSLFHHGASDYLVFGQTNGSFIGCDRQKLCNLVLEKLKEPKERSAWPETALWMPYVRSYENIHTVMSYMDLNDLYDANCLLWVLD